MERHEMILIENTKSNIVGTLLVKTGYAPKNIIFKPGINSIDNKEWDSIKTNPLVKERIEDGILKIALEGKDADAVINSESIASVTPQQAVKLIKATYDVDLLTKWQVNERRPLVNKTLNEQIKQLSLDEVKEESEKFL